MRKTLVITVLNEEKSISQLVKSLLTQILAKDQVIIVDGGSTDKTIEVVRLLQKKYKFVKLYKKKGNISVGRNYGIKMSKSEIIVLTDAGCITKKDWLSKITAPFKDQSVDMVAGFYEMTGDHDFQKAARFFLGVLPQNYDKDNFLPSGRSMAFKKSLWKKIGGFNENLTDAGEDTLFNIEAVKKHAKIVRVKKAIVYWETPKNINQVSKKFFRYALADAEIFNLTKTFQKHTLKIISIYIRYLIFLIFPPFFLIYLYYSIYKFRNVKKNWQTTLIIPIIQLTSDFSVMSGFIYGLFKRYS